MIKPHKEKEYKMMINEETYNLLTSALSLNSNIQINYYYETSNPNLAMRIRKINDEYIYTLKVRRDGYKDEYEFKIDDNSLNDERIKELLNRFHIESYSYLGELTTKRSVLKMKYGELCLDKSEYLNTIDYEIEYELYDMDNENSLEFYELLKKYNLQFIESKYTKLRRFKEKLHESTNTL